jgi:hypothetical protein
MNATACRWNYDSSLWTQRGNTFNESNYDLLAGESKSRAFDTVGFTSIRALDPSNGFRTTWLVTGASVSSLVASSARNTRMGMGPFNPQMFGWVGYTTAYSICEGWAAYYEHPVNGIVQSSVNFYGTYVNGVPVGNVRLGWWGSGSNAWVPAWTSDCGFGLGVKTSGYAGIQERCTTAKGAFTTLWVR